MTPDPDPTDPDQGGRARIRALIRRPVVQTFGTIGAINMLNLVTGAILARELGPAGRGALAAAILWPQLLRFVVMLGAVDAFTYRAARPGADLGRLAGTANWLAVIQGLVLIAIGAAALPLILSRYPDSTLVAAFISLGTVCIGTLGMYYSGMINGLRKWPDYNMITFLTTAFAAAAIIATAATGVLSVEVTMLCYLAGVAPAALIGALVVHREAGGFERRDPSLARELVSYGARAQLSVTRNPLAQQIDQLVVSLFLTPVQLGFYAVAFTVTLIVGFLSAAVSIVAFPTVAATEDAPVQAQMAGRRMAQTLIVTVVAAAPIAIFAEPLIETIFGSEFAAAAPVARILLAAAVLTALVRIAVSVFNGIGRPGESGITGALLIAGSGVGLAVFIPLWELQGAAAGMLAGAAIAFVWSLVRLGRVLDLSPWALLSPANARGR